MNKSDTAQTTYLAIRKWRDKTYSPLLKVLVMFKITPNMVSIFGLLLAFGYLYFIPINLTVAAILMIAAKLIDTIDGALARHLKQKSPSGDLIDMLIDHLVLLIAVAGASYINLISNNWAFLFCFMISYAKWLKLRKKKQINDSNKFSQLFLEIIVAFIPYILLLVFYFSGFNLFPQILPTLTTIISVEILYLLIKPRN